MRPYCNPVIHHAKPLPRSRVVTGYTKSLFSSMFLVFCTSAISCGCNTKRGNRLSAEKTYNAWSKAVQNGRCEDLYDLLDEKSRWAVMSMAKDAGKAAALINKHYPNDRKPGALARIGPVAGFRPDKWMTRYCLRENLIQKLKPFSGEPKNIKRSINVYRVTTPTGEEVTLLRDKYGHWGCNALYDHLKKAQIRMANILKITRENAALFGKK